MRKELGEDAVILSSRTVPRSPVNGKEAVEITAAMDTTDIVSARRPIVAAENPTPFALDILQYAEAYARESTMKNPARATAAATATSSPVEEWRSEAPRTPERDSEYTMQQTTAFIRLQEEISSIRDTLHTVAGDVRYKHSGSLTPACRKIYEALIDAELKEKLALEAIGSVMRQGLGGNFASALRATRKYLVGNFAIAEPLQCAGKRRTFAFVGPTGVGKTTTIAKLATAMHVLGELKVLLISADTYRVGGAEQLETIAAIAGIPFYAVYSSQELRQILMKETSVDCVFIDTVGRNPRHTGHVQEIKAYMEAAAPDRTFLVQSATVSESTFRQTVEKFGVVGTTDLIVTKLDETPVVGPIVGGLHTHALPLAYFTTGQSIPDDIEPASRKLLAELLLPQELESEEQEVTIE